MKRLITFAACLLVLFSLVTTAAATETEEATEVTKDGLIIYTGHNDKVEFISDSDYHHTDQFHNFKTVMPGDVIDQRILIRNIAKDCRIDVYMHALGAHETSEDFLSQLKMKIVLDDDTTIFDASAADAAQLHEFMFVTGLDAGRECELVVTLEVPVTLGNEYANQIGYLDWEFGIREFPVDPQPETGDRSSLALWAGVSAVSVSAIFLLLTLPRKKKAE